MEGRLTKKERKEQKRLHIANKMEEKPQKTKFIIIFLVCVLFLALSAFGIYTIKMSKNKRASASVSFLPSGWVTGNTKSSVTVTEFGDFQCPACFTFETTMRRIRSEYGNKVKIVYKHFPLRQAHPNALPSAIAAEAAGKQGKFWEFHDLLYDNQNIWAGLSDPNSEFIKYAEKLKLDTTMFKKELGNSKHKEAISAQEDEGIKIGVNATPTVYVNGMYMGVPSYEDLKKKIDDALAASKK
ncbi:MAG TPA: thioredoxin domain-containing protein [Candidatus Levybacteria bacterium]|nr:thioredoxin domain-containing protein [Candidatus Levybacteria bacterium]